LGSLRIHPTFNIGENQKNIILDLNRLINPLRILKDFDKNKYLNYVNKKNRNWKIWRNIQDNGRTRTDKQKRKKPDDRIIDLIFVSKGASQLERENFVPWIYKMFEADGTISA